jgi:hypothetical protein
MDEKVVNEAKKNRAAFKRVFESRDGQVVVAQFEKYKAQFIDFAMDCKEQGPQTMAINQASGVDGVLKLIEGMMRAAAADEKKAKEAADKQES